MSDARPPTSTPAPATSHEQAAAPTSAPAPAPAPASAGREPTLQELRDQHEALTQKLLAAEKAAREKPPMPKEEVEKIHREALEKHEATSSDEERHKIAEDALKKLEDGNHKGPEIDQLAQLVVDARGE